MTLKHVPVIVDFLHLLLQLILFSLAQLVGFLLQLGLLPIRLVAICSLTLPLPEKT